MQSPEQNFFNVAGEETEARGAGGMITIMLCIAAVFTAIAAIICFMT